jgi:hypothetical protein
MRIFCLVSSTGYLTLDTFFKVSDPNLSTILDLDPRSSTNVEFMLEPKMGKVRGFSEVKPSDLLS